MVENSDLLSFLWHFLVGILLKEKAFTSLVGHSRPLPQESAICPPRPASFLWAIVLSSFLQSIFTGTRVLGCRSFISALWGCLSIVPSLPSFLYKSLSTFLRWFLCKKRGSMWGKKKIFAFHQFYQNVPVGVFFFFPVLTLRFAELSECVAVHSSSVLEVFQLLCLLRFLSSLPGALLASLSHCAVVRSLSCVWLCNPVARSVPAPVARVWLAWPPVVFIHFPGFPSRSFLLADPPVSSVLSLLLFISIIMFSVLGFLFDFWFQFSGKIFCFFVSVLKQASGGYLHFLTDDPSVWIPCRFASAICVLS